MSAFHGKNGTVKFDNTFTADIINWTLNITGDLAESTSMSATFKSYLAGFSDWTATVDCLVPSGGLEPTIADVGLTAKTLLLETTTGKLYQASGTAMLIGWTITQDAQDVSKITYEYQGMGKITEEI